jgi:hypothetical protein
MPSVSLPRQYTVDEKSILLFFAAGKGVSLASTDPPAWPTSWAVFSTMTTCPTLCLLLRLMLRLMLLLLSLYCLTVNGAPEFSASQCSSAISSVKSCVEAGMSASMYEPLDQLSRRCCGTVQSTNVMCLGYIDVAASFLSIQPQTVVLYLSNSMNPNRVGIHFNDGRPDVFSTATVTSSSTAPQVKTILENLLTSIGLRFSLAVTTNGMPTSSWTISYDFEAQFSFVTKDATSMYPTSSYSYVQQRGGPDEVSRRLMFVLYGEQPSQQSGSYMYYYSTSVSPRQCKGTCLSVCLCLCRSLMYGRNAAHVHVPVVPLPLVTLPDLTCR